jgi:predicted PurR-regulated permease PerM
MTADIGPPAGDRPVMFPAPAPRAGLPAWAVVGIFVILAVAAVAAAEEFLMPLTMAVLLFFVFSPLRRRLGRRGVPSWVTASLVTGGLLAALGAISLMLSGPAGELVADAPRIALRLDQKFEELKREMGVLGDLADRMDDTPEPGGTDASVTDKAAPEILWSLAGSTPTLVSQLLFVIVLLYFMIASGDLLYLKIVQSFDGIGRKRRSYEALRQIEDSLGSYLGTITLINLGLGTAIGLTFWWLGMPAPALFGVAAFLLNYVPFVGLLIGAAISTAVALVSMDGFFWPLMAGASYVGYNAVEAQFITPYFLSRRLELNPVIVLVAVALWAWLWSIVGMIVAVPILVVVRVLCEHIPGLEKFGNFLAGDTAPVPESDGADEAT